MYRTADGLVHIRTKYYFQAALGARCEILYDAVYEDHELVSVVGGVPTCLWCWATPPALDVA